jgi:hypothetical protein
MTPHTDDTLPSTTTHSKVSTSIKSGRSTPPSLAVGFTVACSWTWSGIYGCVFLDLERQ